MFKRTLLAALFLIVSVSVGSLLAEESRGRTADGRAYRVDTQGNQLVDYIAELELEVDSLKRRTLGLEDEVSEKQKIIDRLGSGQSASGDLKEKDLVRVSAKENEAQAVKAVEVSCPACPSCQICPSCNVANCESENARYQQSLEQLRSELEEQKTAYNAREASLRGEIEDLNQGIEERSSEIENLRAEADEKLEEADKRMAKELSAARTAQQDLEVEKQLQAKELEDVKNQLASAREALNEKDGALQVAQNKLGEVVPLAAAAQAREQEFQNLKTQMAASRQPEVQRPAQPQGLAYLPESRASFSNARQRAVDAVRSSVLTDINKLASTIASRDGLFRERSARSRNLSLKPVQAVASSGLSFEDVKKRAAAAATVSELSGLKRDISEIRNLIQEDIALVKRVGG